jgi:hypothetical protein
VFLTVFISGLAIAQTSAPNTPSDTSTLADEVKQLRQMMAEQQKAMSQQQKQFENKLAEQQAELQKLRQQVNPQAQAVSSSSTDSSTADSVSGPRLVNASLTAPASAAKAAAQPVSSATLQETERKESPLSFRIGAAEFTPGGFVDFENVFRTTNTGGVAATSYGGIPFSNAANGAGRLTEYRATGQYSRFNIKVTNKFGKNDVTGYLEFDFNGNDATNVFVTSNGHTDRIRLYWLDLKRGKWEFLGGQTWGLQTPNRVGVSPNPSDLALGYQEDAGVGVGYNYTRAGEFRAAYHFNDHFVWAVAAQNPDQFTNNEVVFPNAFTTPLNAQFDGTNGANQTTTPNVGPDFLTKFAWDTPTGGGKNLHLEAGGLETAVKASVQPTVTGATFHSKSSVGGGFFGGIVADLWKGAEGRNIRYVASGMWGYGVGRYLNGLAPQAVVVPISAAGTTCAIVAGKATGCDVSVSQIHSGDIVTGFEFVPHPKAQLGAYYGGMYAQRNAFVDITQATKPVIGFGGVGSGTSNNRAIQQGTIDWVQTFWRNPQYGAVQLYLQESYLTRAPWFVAAGAPKNAHLFMSYLSLRYVLP